MTVPWTARRSNQSILKEISAEYSLEELILKLKLQYFGHLIRRADRLAEKRLGDDNALKLMFIKLVMPSNHLILCHPLLLPPSIFPSMRGFSNESVLRIRWPKYWSFSFNISPSNEYSGLISFRIDWLALTTVQGTLKSFLQHHSSKVLILWCSAFFMVQL